MSDQFYAVQFRSMHTGKHNIAVFSLETEAQWFLIMVSNGGEIENSYTFDPDSFVGIEEIDHHNKPCEAFGLEILYMNEYEANIPFGIPDVFNY